MSDQRATPEPEASEPQLPGPFDDSLAARLRLTKREVLASADDGSGTVLNQFGGRYIDAAIDLPEAPADRSVGEPLIDMFVCGLDGSCQATGADASLITRWQPAVTAMADAVFSQLAQFGVPVAPVAYVTASFTPGTDVVGEAHLDDDQFMPDDGIGVVAILGSDVGSRVATSPVTVAKPRPGLPLEIDQATFDRFTAGDLPHQQASQNRILVFGQFGQLHAGPALATTSPDVTRRLLVLRAQTIPDRPR